MRDLLSTVLRAILAGVLTIVIYLLLHLTLPFPWAVLLAVFLGLSITQLFTSYLKGDTRKVSKQDLLKSLAIGLLATLGLWFGLWIMV